MGNKPASQLEKIRELQATVSFLNSRRSVVEGELDRTRAVLQIRTSEVKAKEAERVTAEGKLVTLVGEHDKLKESNALLREQCQWHKNDSARWNSSLSKYYDKCDNLCTHLFIVYVVLAIAVGFIAYEHLKVV